MAIDVTEIKIRDKVTIAGSEITSVESTLTGSSTAIPRADAVKGYVDNVLSASDAMVFKGTIGTGGTVTALPTTHSAGWTYRVITAGTYAGVTAEVGDLIIAVIDRAGSSNANSDWTIVQTNIDGAVTGPASAVSTNVASFNGTGGKIIQDSGVAFETTLTTNSDAKAPTSKAVATYVTGLGYVTSSGVTSVGATSPVASSGGTTPTISLSSGYGDTQNPYASKTANTFLAAPNGTAGVPTFRTIVAADIPTLNQNTTGNAATATSADNIDGIAFRNGNSTNAINPDNVNENGTGYITNVSLFGQTDGALYSQAYNSSWVHQIFGDYRTGSMAVRGRNNGTLTSWRTIWDSGNDGSGSGLDADTVDGYQASSLWRNDGGTWNPGANIALNQSANNQEWSFDITRNGFTGGYWHVWDSALSTLLRVNAQDGAVSAPYSFSTPTATVSGNLTAARYYQSANGIPTGNLGSPTVTEMALFDEQFYNQTAFYDITKLKFYTSTDNVTWTEVTTISDTNKRALVGGDAGSGITIPNLTPYYRIEITNNGNYVFLNALYMYVTTSSHSMSIKIKARRRSDLTFVNITSSNNTVNLWPGHVYMPFNTIPFLTGGSSSGHYDIVHIDFQPTWSGDPTYGSNPIYLTKLQIWGGYPAGKRNIYSTDENRNVAFPAALTGTRLFSTIATGTSPLSVTSTTVNTNLNADLLDGYHSSSFVLKSGDTSTGLTVFDGGIHVLSGTGGGKLRIKRNSNSTDGDDIVDIHLDDNSIYFDMDNDNDNDAGDFFFRYKTGGTFSNLLYFGTGTINYKGNTIWHAGNDGASSGLDADLLDGNHASAFYLASNPSGYTSNTGTVTSVGGTGTVAGLTLTGTVTTTGNLTLGGTLSTPVSTINDSTTVGQNLVKLANPSAIRFIRINADNTVSSLSDSDFRTAIGAGTGSGTVTSVTATSPIASSGGTTPVISVASGFTIPTSTEKGNYDTAYTDTSNATDANTASRIVKRDASGNFSAGTITAALTGTASGNIVATGSRTAGNIPTWFTTSGNSLGNGYTVETTLSGASTAIPRADAVKNYVDGLLSANDAMVFKGTVGTGGTFTIANFNALATYQAGWTYRVIEAGTIKGKVSEVGDLVIATVDRAGSSNVDDDWTTVQTNIDGAVTGPASATSGNIATFNGTGGKIIQDGGASIETTLTTNSDTKIPTSKAVSTYVTGLGYTTNTGTVTSVGGTGTVAGLTLTGTVTTSGNLTLGGTLSTPVSTINDSTTVGQNLVKLTNPSAIRFIRINADNTVTALSDSDFRTAIGAGTSSTTGTVTSVSAGTQISGMSMTITNGTTTPSIATSISNAANFRTAIGAGTGNGTVTSVGGTGTVAGLTLTGTVTTSGNLTLGGTLSTPVSTINDSTTVGQNLVKLTNPSAITFLRVNADNTVTALSAANFRTATGSAADADVVKLTGAQSVAGVKTLANSFTGASGTSTVITSEVIAGALPSAPLIATGLSVTATGNSVDFHAATGIKAKAIGGLSNTAIEAYGTDGILIAQSDTSNGKYLIIKGVASGTANSTTLQTNSATSSSITVTLPSVTGTLTTGSGTTNELSYWSGSGTLATLSTATYPSLTELSYVKGVTSAIQTQISAKPSGSGGAADRIAYWTDSNTLGGLTTITYPSLTELSYVKGVTSAIQTQLNGKADISHLGALELVYSGTTTVTHANATDTTTITLDSGKTLGSTDVILLEVDGANSATTAGFTKALVMIRLGSNQTTTSTPFVSWSSLDNSTTGNSRNWSVLCRYSTSSTLLFRYAGYHLGATAGAKTFSTIYVHRIWKVVT